MQKLDHNDDNLKKEIKKIKHEYHFDYKKMIKHLKKDERILLNGCTAYATYYNLDSQTVGVGQMLLLEYELNNKNIKHANNSPNVVICEAGTYIINFTVLLTQPETVSLYLNNTIDNTSTTVGQTININRVLVLNKDDVLSFRNNSSNPLTTLSGTKNLELTVWKIAQNPNVCKDSSDSE